VWNLPLIQPNASPDDTQPRFPKVTLPDHGGFIDPEPAARSGPGCFVYALVGTVLVGLAVIIVVLASVAGWTSGQHVAQTNATATQSAAIQEQLNRIPADVSSGNQVLLNARIEYLATLTPGVAGLPDIVSTATAVYLNSLPTVTPTPGITPTAAATLAPTAAPQATTQSGGVVIDLPALFSEAQTAIAVSDWDTAIESLDIILSADSTYEQATVRQMMSQSLTSKALALFRSGDTADLAQANLLTDRARQYGDVADLEYESYIAGQYLDAVNSEGVDFSKAIQALTNVYNQVPNYRDVRSRLFNQYAAYGDALVAGGQVCFAVVQYQNALNLSNDAIVSGKMNAAATACANPTPVPLPGTELTPGAIAPVGQQ
jgi:tetratricopeptide (TPR) repeat protein